MENQGVCIQIANIGGAFCGFLAIEIFRQMVDNAIFYDGGVFVGRAIG